MLMMPLFTARLCLQLTIMYPVLKNPSEIWQIKNINKNIVIAKLNIAITFEYLWQK